MDVWPKIRILSMSLETFVKTGERLNRLPNGLPAEMTTQAAGAFVSLHAHGQLRGCIGTTGPTTESVAWEIVQNAVFACSRDPRLHLSRFFPRYRMTDKPPTPVERVYQLAGAAGEYLSFVYTGNC